MQSAEIDQFRRFVGANDNLVEIAEIFFVFVDIDMNKSRGAFQFYSRRQEFLETGDHLDLRPFVGNKKTRHRGSVEKLCRAGRKAKKAEWKVRFLSFIALVAIIEIGTLDIDTSENFVIGANISQFFGILGTIAGFYRYQNARKNSRKSGRDRDSEE